MNNRRKNLRNRTLFLLSPSRRHTSRRRRIPCFPFTCRRYTGCLRHLAKLVVPNNILKQILVMNKSNVFLGKKIHIIEESPCIFLVFVFPWTAKYSLTMAIHMDGPDIWVGVHIPKLIHRLNSYHFQDQQARIASLKQGHHQ